MRGRRIVAVLGVMLVWLVTSALPADAATLRLFSRMSGENEVPGPGDPDGAGVTVVDISSNGRVCVELAFNGIKPPTGFHIHQGSETEAGPVVIDFTSLIPTRGGCVEADPALVQQIRDHPAGFYTNVHTEQFPLGAIRGQLRRSR
jgi:CHRD domain